MKAAVLSGYNRFEIKDIPKPEPGDKQVLVKVDYASICGTDLHIFRGEFHPRTRLPFVPGHEFAGTVAQVGKDVENIRVGEQVAVDPIIWCGECAACKIGHYPACTSLKLLGVDMDGGFAQYVVADARMLYPVGAGVSARDAALVEVYSIGFHACKRVEVGADDTIAIWGAGRIGQSILQAARTRTTLPIFLVDILDERLAVPKGYYDNIIPINAHHENPVDRILKETGGRGVDIAFEAVGHATPLMERPNPIQGCINSIRGAGTVCLLGLTAEPTPLVMRDLIWKEGKLITSRVSHGEFEDAITQLKQNNLNPGAIISEVMPLDEIQQAFRLLQEKPQQYLKILIDLTI